ncbi:unnamed protein product [Vitrella brassicaformis CCMP3155]|uniref:Amino acid transporter transmembrane domain-containing protein n=2 Tax=Vitrella brassicaformis TaxID=1169539 RepID=A0A0G4H7S9_VITBC|nr:unnamed protein product [Vitrella brassicaformis CCMP3155]|mmetsp:Transcript_12853/g.30662  ORF Transcript_12853/g.30662 Transcript_12853/m.30662 type:complete len:597 (+) Transcript_12853:62-1852(+)|eukprot:CEM39819.1 unnamed protein product [Vitrella brassicaformis CCMP3155]
MASSRFDSDTDQEPLPSSLHSTWTDTANSLRTTYVDDDQQTPVSSSSHRPTAAVFGRQETELSDITLISRGSSLTGGALHDSAHTPSPSRGDPSLPLPKSKIRTDERDGLRADDDEWEGDQPEEDDYDASPAADPAIGGRISTRSRTSDDSPSSDTPIMPHKWGKATGGESADDIALHEETSPMVEPGPVVFDIGTDEKKGTGLAKTELNAFIAFIGAGILDLPYAFSQSGVLLGTAFLSLLAVTALHCMLLLVDCKYYLMNERHKNIKTYGDIGWHAFGKTGSVVVEVFLVITQTGFCIAYLIFIGENLANVFHFVSFGEIVMYCLPLLVLLCWLRDMRHLAWSSLLADATNLFGLGVVYFFDLHRLVAVRKAPPAVAIARSSTLPFFFGVGLYCFEGIGMVLPIENSMKDKQHFKKLWSLNMLLVTTLFISFGLLGYCAFGSDTDEIVTHNLPHNVISVLVRGALSLGLFLTYPIMLVPVFEILEETLCKDQRLVGTCSWKGNLLRASLVVLTGMVSVAVPNFNIFISLVGSSASTCLAFLLPALFHLKLRWDELRSWQVVRECLCIALGVGGAVLGTTHSAAHLIHLLVSGEG